jgi:hypothetical protein
LETSADQRQELREFIGNDICATFDSNSKGHHRRFTVVGIGVLDVIENEGHNNGEYLLRGNIGSQCVEYLVGKLNHERNRMS